MDPLSAFGLISGAFQVGQVIAETLHGLASLRGKYQHADLTIGTLEHQLTTIRAAVTHLEDWTKARLREFPAAEYSRSLDVALDGCRTVLEALSEEILVLTQGASPNETGIGFRTRVRVVWREDVMKGHQDRLHSQVMALQLLVQACQCQSSAEQVQLLRRAENRHIIWRVADDAATIRSSNRSRYAGSRADTASSLSHRMESSSAVGGSTVFDFDGTLASSLPYIRAPPPQAAYSRPESWSTRSYDDRSQTTTDEGYSSGVATSTTTVSRTGSLLLPSHPSGMISPTVGHSNSASLSPTTARSPTSSYTRRSKSDVTPTTQLNRGAGSGSGSGSKREKIQSVFRRLSYVNLRPGSSPQVPTRGTTNASTTRRRPYDKDVNTSIDLTSPDGTSAPLIVKTAQAGSWSDVERLLERGNELEARHLQSRRTALLVAAHCGNEAVVDLLIRKGARLDATDRNGSTALHLAASRGHCGVLELLVSEMSGIEARDSRGRTALWVAAERGEIEVTHILLLAKAKVNARADGHMAALHVASKQGDEAIVKVLVNAGADIEAKDGTMMTALHYACEKGHVGVMEILLDKKVDVDVPGSDRRSPLICAAAVGGVQATNLLLKRKASSRCVDDAGMTALHWAAYNGHTEIVEILISSRKSSLTKVNVTGRTALHLAAMNSQFPVVELLLRKEMPMETRCQAGLAALHYACLADNTEISKLLLMSGADIESPMDGELQRRPVHIAAAQGSMRLLNLLCDKGASLEARDALGYRALGVAARAGHAAAVQNLLDRNSAVHMQLETWSRDDSPLCLAAAGGHLPVVILLLERGASPLKQDEQDWWPYQYAAYHGHPQILEILLIRTLAGSAADTLQLDGIGFAPAADISSERKREVLDLLHRARRQPSTLLQGSHVPNGSSMTPVPQQVMNNNRVPVSSGPGHMPAHFVSSLAPVPEFTNRANTQGIQELPGTLEQGLPDSRSQTPEQMHRPPSRPGEDQVASQPNSRTALERPPLFGSSATAQLSFPPTHERAHSLSPVRPPLNHPIPVRDPSGFLLGGAGLFAERFNDTPVSTDEEITTHEGRKPPPRLAGEGEEHWGSNSTTTLAPAQPPFDSQ